MAIRKIARMGHPVLRETSRPVEDPTSPETARLARDLIDTCEDIGGNGIAAPQVHESLRMFVYRVRKAVMPEGAHMREIPWTVVVNPVLTPIGDDTDLYWERCLSLPDLYGQARRFVRVRLEWIDLQGTAHALTAHRYHARLLQHEHDHLDGVLYPMRMPDISTLGYVSELEPRTYPNLPCRASDFVDPDA